MARAAGYILVLDKDRAAIFGDSRIEGSYFAEAVPEFEHSRTSALVVFISAEPNAITHIARGKRGVRAGTNQRRLNLEDIREVKKPIAVKRIEDSVSTKVWRHMMRRLSKGGLLPPRTFEEFVDAVLRLTPELRDVLSTYSKERQERIHRLSSEARRALGAQKEVLNTALHIADIDRSPLLKWVPIDNAPPTSILEGLEETRLLEDAMIWHDLLEPLEGFAEVKKSITGAAKFQSEFVDLEVIVANRTPLEKQTGADLIYFNATFRSFVLVQYKAMEKVGAGQEATFRLPDPQLEDEIARMDAILAAFKGTSAPSHRHHYRLNGNPFFLKLCPRIVLHPDSVGLTPGMYLPLDYWRFIEKDSDMIGNRGGRIVTYRNVGRYLDNSSFAAVVRSAWIGTTPSQTALLAPVIQVLLKGERAVLVAVRSDKQQPKGRTVKVDLGEEDEEELEDG